jgi:hypothetical protein
VIPGTPNDQITASKIGLMWERVIETKLGELWEDERLVGYNDLENYLSVEYGLLLPKRYRVLRKFKISYTLNELEEFWRSHVSPYAALKSMKVYLHSVNENDLGFAPDDIATMQVHNNSISESIENDRGVYSHKRFDNIKKLLESTRLPEPPSEQALPKQIELSEKKYNQFIEQCPSYMNDYKKKLVKPALSSFTI